MRLRQLLNELEFGNIIPSKLPAGPGSVNDKINQQLANTDKDTAQIQAQATANRKKTYATPANKSYNDQMTDLDREEQAALDKLSKTSARPITGNKLFESKKQGAAIIFGRFNPPHFGHSNAWNVASKFPIWYVGTNQSTQGPKDPLPFEIKVEAMKTIMPGIEGHLVPEQSWWTLATMVYKKHGGNMILHVVTDPTDQEIFVPGLKKFNGVEGAHGYYKFIDVLWAPATRDSTATALRAAVEHNNPQAFSKAAGIPADTMIAGKPFFELVKQYISPYLHASAEKARIKAEKDAAKAAKHNKVAAEDAAGVGVITKQNSTVDVNSSTPRKNLKAFNLIKEANKVIREMRAQEFVTESHANAGSGFETELNKDHDNVMKGASRSRDLGGYDRVYHMNRLMMAMAMHDGKGPHPVNSAHSTWFEKYNTMHPMTQEEDNMIRGAMKTVPTDGKHVSKFAKSKEAEGGNVSSPVAKPKRNKYGV